MTYLNKHHDKKLIEWFKRERIEEKGLWNSVSYYDYIGSHLGYRFVIKDAAIYKEKNGAYVEITVENCGFAPMYQDTEIILVSESDGILTETVFEKKLNICYPGEIIAFTTKIEPKAGTFFLYARQIIGNRKVLFANRTQEKDGKVYIGEII